MPPVLLGLDCFEVSAGTTAAAAARELAGALHPALPDTAGSVIEVYRLVRLDPEASLCGEEGPVLCRIPAWRFDLPALEGLHEQLEDLQLQYGRAKEALIELSSDMEVNAATASECISRVPLSPQHEILRLRRQLAQSERNQQETKATVIALRNEFMHLLEVWGTDASVAKPEGAVGPGVLEANVKSLWCTEARASLAADLATPEDGEHLTRLGQACPMGLGARRLAGGSPRAWGGAALQGFGLCNTPGAAAALRLRAAAAGAQRPRSAGRRTVRSAGATLAPRRMATMG